MAEKVKKCPKCKQECNWLFTECDYCGADISKEIVIEKASRYDNTGSERVLYTSDYLRIMGWLSLGLSVVALIYLVYYGSIIGGILTLIPGRLPMQSRGESQNCLKENKE